MIRRFPGIIRFVLFVLCSAAYLSMLFVDCHIALRYLIAAAWVGSVIFYAASRRCPCCRRFGLDNRPFSKNSGYCSHCGKLIEYRRKELTL